MKIDQILHKIALDSNGRKIGIITGILSHYKELESNNKTHVEITPQKRKYREMAIKIELSKILHLNDKKVQFDITESEFIEKAIQFHIEREKIKKLAEREEELGQLKKQASEIKKAIYRFLEE